MIDVYFIRHGETEYNRTSCHQPDDIPLDELGRRQAAATEPVVTKLGPTHLIASPLTRAVETAEALNKNLPLDIVRDERFREITRPDYLVGKSHFSLASVWYMFTWFFNPRSMYWEKCNAESRSMFRTRIKEAKAYLESLPDGSRVVVVSHAVFINFFIEQVCTGRPIPFVRAALLLKKVKSLDNSSISHLRYDSSLPDMVCKWNVESYDDDTHVVT